MLHWPFRPPDSACSLFPGGIRRSSRLMAAWSIKSFRLAGRWISGGYLLDISPFHILSVSLSRNEDITTRYYYITIVMSSAIIWGGRRPLRLDLKGPGRYLRRERCPER